MSLLSFIWLDVGKTIAQKLHQHCASLPIPDGVEEDNPYPYSSCSLSCVAPYATVAAATASVAISLTNPLSCCCVAQCCCSTAAAVGGVVQIIEAQNSVAVAAADAREAAQTNERAVKDLGEQLEATRQDRDRLIAALADARETAQKNERTAKALEERNRDLATQVNAFKETGKALETRNQELNIQINTLKDLFQNGDATLKRQYADLTEVTKQLNTAQKELHEVVLKQNETQTRLEITEKALTQGVKEFEAATKRREEAEQRANEAERRLHEAQQQFIITAQETTRGAINATATGIGQRFDQHVDTLVAARVTQVVAEQLDGTGVPLSPVSPDRVNIVVVPPQSGSTADLPGNTKGNTTPQGKSDTIA